MDIQEVFNKVAQHLMAQNRQSEDTEGDCMYRGEDGLMCAVGCLIKDEFYSAGLEYLAANESVVEDALRKSGIEPSLHGDLLLNLQYCHDDYAVFDWPSQLRRIARRFDLAVPGCIKEAP